MGGKMIETYLIFVGNTYYPGKGIEDLHAIVHSLEAVNLVLEDVKENEKVDLESNLKWYTVVDLNQWKTIIDSEDE